MSVKGAGSRAGTNATEVTSLQAFMSEVLTDPLNGVETFFRGAAKVWPTSSPSVFRSPELRKSEKDLFNSLLASHPESFAEDATTLDLLVRMQHHGLPTRLLDITSNPLMALYFASEAEPDEDGEVTRFEFRSVHVKYPDSDRAAVMANLARLTPAQKRGLNVRLDEKAFNRLPAVKQLLHFIRREKPYFEATMNSTHIESIMVIRGKQNNKRIIAQSGAFLLFGEKVDLETSAKGQDARLRKFRIPSGAKSRILNELDQLNINERTVYPGLESSARYLRERYGKSR